VSFFEITDLTLRFGGVQALRGVSFAVEKGEVFAIIGPNGAGKTSIFNVVTRVFDANAGRVVLDGVDITRTPRHQVVAHGIARTFQNIELFEAATVMENLLVGRHRHGGSSFLAELVSTPAVARAEAEHRRAVEDIIDLLRLAPYRSLPVAGLPYGVRKVVELGRALAAGPRLLLLDEPASGLNPEETRDLAFWIEDIANDLGTTVVMVEHDMSLVADVSDRVLVMNQGEVLALGTADEVRANEAVAVAYLGIEAPA
jgi:branched-chain amino acid transport system ATP-binding protein